MLKIPAAPARAPMHFHDIGRQAGLTTVPHSSSERRYIVETMGGGGIALFDCDNDAKLDIAVVNDSTIERYLRGGDPMITLYHQDSSSGQIHFTDVTDSAGLKTRGWGMGIAVGDFDNDGLPELYVTGYGCNVLYHNLGGCKFEDVTRQAGLEAGGFSTGAAWADYDRGGRLDLFVTRYVHADLRHLPPPDPNATGYGSVILQLPGQMPGETHLLFRNRGGGAFEDVSQKAGVSNPGKLHGMGVVWGDYDNDGWPDLLVTNDGGRNFLYHNNRDGTFEDAGLISGVALGPDGETLGNMAADFGDFDRDGNLDAVVFNAARPPSLFLNHTRNANHRVLFRLVGSRSNSAAIGARVSVHTPGMTQIDEVRGGGSYNSTHDTRLHFGLGRDPVMSKVEVQWPSGLKQEFRNLAGDAIYEIVEGQGLKETLKLPAPGS